MNLSAIPEVADAFRIASAACEEEQPMPCEKAEPLVIADCCEIIAERYAKDRHWRKVAISLRMACWYYRKAND